jgi:hypothetical protein
MTHAGFRKWSPGSAPRGPFNGAKRLDLNQKKAGNLNFAWIETVFSTFELTLVAEVSSVFTNRRCESGHSYASMR